MLPDIRDALEGKALATREVKQFLVRAGLLSPEGTPTSLGQRVATILNEVEALPPARQQELHTYFTTKTGSSALRGNLSGTPPSLLRCAERNGARASPAFNLSPRMI